MTKKRSYRRYSPEFKREAIKRACDEGMTDAAVCKELGISARQFRRWRDERKYQRIDPTILPQENVFAPALTESAR